MKEMYEVKPQQILNIKNDLLGLISYTSSYFIPDYIIQNQNYFFCFINAYTIVMEKMYSASIYYQVAQ